MLGVLDIFLAQPFGGRSLLQRCESTPPFFYIIGYSQLTTGCLPLRSPRRSSRSRHIFSKSPERSMTPCFVKRFAYLCMPPVRFRTFIAPPLLPRTFISCAPSCTEVRSLYWTGNNFPESNVQDTSGKGGNGKGRREGKIAMTKVRQMRRHGYSKI